MHVLHENKQIETRVPKSLRKTGPHSLAGLQANSVPLDTVMRQLTLLGRQPLCRQRLVGQQEDANSRYANGNDSLDDEQPLPAMHAMFIIQRGKCRRSNQARKRDRENVTSVQNRHPRGNLFARVKQTQDVQRSRVKRRLDKAQEEAHQDQASVVLDQRCESRYTAPNRAAHRHVDRRPHFVRRHEHVAGNLREEVSHVKNRYARVVLAANEPEVLFKSVESCICDRVLVELVASMVLAIC